MLKIEGKKGIGSTTNILMKIKMKSSAPKKAHKIFQFNEQNIAIIHDQQKIKGSKKK